MLPVKSAHRIWNFATCEFFEQGFSAGKCDFVKACARNAEEFAPILLDRYFGQTFSFRAADRSSGWNRSQGNGTMFNRESPMSAWGQREIRQRTGRQNDTTVDGQHTVLCCIVVLAQRVSCRRTHRECPSLFVTSRSPGIPVSAPRNRLFASIIPAPRAAA